MAIDHGEGTVIGLAYLLLPRVDGEFRNEEWRLMKSQIETIGRDAFHARSREQEEPPETPVTPTPEQPPKEPTPSPTPSDEEGAVQTPTPTDEPDAVPTPTETGATATPGFGLVGALIGLGGAGYAAFRRFRSGRSDDE